MSILHTILYRNNFNHDVLSKCVVAQLTISFGKNGETVYYCIENESARGVDVTVYENYIEVRNTTLSNENWLKLFIATKPHHINKLN